MTTRLSKERERPQGPGDGLHRCPNVDCGWAGVPTSINGVIVALCPVCERDELEELKEGGRQEWAKRNAARKAGRNAPCPCGSGKKSKKCCA